MSVRAQVGLRFQKSLELQLLDPLSLLELLPQSDDEHRLLLSYDGDGHGAGAGALWCMLTGLTGLNGLSGCSGLVRSSLSLRAGAGDGA